MNITIPTIILSEDLWADPSPATAPAPKQRKPRKPRKPAVPALSAHAQSSVDMAERLGIGLFEYVEHPITHQRILFYAAYNSLVKDYGWLPSSFLKWGAAEKHMIERSNRLAELSYGR